MAIYLPCTKEPFSGTRDLPSSTSSDPMGSHQSNSARNLIYWQHSTNITQIKEPTTVNWRQGSRHTNSHSGCRHRLQRLLICLVSHLLSPSFMVWTKMKPEALEGSVYWHGAWWNGASASPCWFTGFRSAATAGMITITWRLACASTAKKWIVRSQPC